MHDQQKGDRIFQEGTRVGKKLRAAIKARSSQTSSESDYRRAARFFFNKAFKTYEAIRHLWKPGYVEDATVLGRTLFELNTQAEWMSRDPQVRARQLFEHYSVRVYDLHSRLTRDAERMGDAETAKIVNSFAQHPGFNELKSDHDKYRHKFIRTRKRKQTVWENWWNGSLLDLTKWLDKEIRERREEQSDDFEWEYAFVYFQECELAHTGTTSLVQYLKPDSAAVFPSTSHPLWLPYSSSVRFLRTADILRLAYNIGSIDDFYLARSEILRLSGF